MSKGNKVLEGILETISEKGGSMMQKDYKEAGGNGVHSTDGGMTWTGCSVGNDLENVDKEREKV